MIIVGLFAHFCSPAIIEDVGLLDREKSAKDQQRALDSD